MKSMLNARAALSVLAVASLAACGGGGGGGSTTTTSQGTFLDSAVEGMSYTCGSNTGTTDASGRFNYVAGDTCTFRIGGVTVGSATAAATLTPVSLVSGALDETHATVGNIARFLQSVDTDGNPSNGITVAASVRTALASTSLNFSSGSFDTDLPTVVTLAGGTLTSKAAAEAHLKSSLLAKMAGTYNCTYSGSDRGTATATLSSSGTISGTATSTLYNYSCALSGSFSSSGVAAFNAGGSCGGASFSGNLSLNGGGSGNWSGTGVSGAWSCTK